MIKPLLRTIPQLSGNVKISSILTDIKEVSNNIFESEIRYATLQPLSSDLYQKNIEANLLNSTYAFDLKKYYTYYNDIFFESNFDFNKQDMYIVDKTTDQYFRNTDFEFGVKRISSTKSGYQYAFFAPIYIDSINSIPYQFVIELLFSNSRYSLKKELRINIGKDSNRNYINKYISKYVNSIDTDVVYMDNQDKTISYYGIDLINGGFSKKTDSTLSSLFNIQMPIQMFDQSIMNGFARNIICMKQILPLAYLFNATDVLTNEEIEKFKYCDIQLSGYYIDNNGSKLDFYDFDFDYDMHRENIVSMNPNNGALAYYNGYVSNIMDVGFPSFNDKYLTNWMFSNKMNAEYCRWKLKYSSDEYPYITNMSWAFSKNQNSNYKYKEFPTSYLPQTGYAIVNDQLKYDLIFPFSDNKVYYDSINTRSAIKYKNIMNSYCLNWFDVLHNNVFTDNNINVDEIKWSDVDNGYTYFNSVLYNINEIYNKITDKTKIDKFAFLVYPDVSGIKNSEHIQQNIKFVTYTLENSDNNNCSILDDINNGLFNINGDPNISIQTQKAYKKAEEGFTGKTYVNLKDLGLEYYSVNKIYRRSDISRINNLSKVAKTSISGISELRNLFNDIYGGTVDVSDNVLKVLKDCITVDESDNINDDLLPNVFKQNIGYDLYERIPVYKGTSYIDTNQSIKNTLGKYLQQSGTSAKLYYTTQDDINIFNQINIDSKIDNKTADSIYGITLYNRDYFVDKYYFSPENVFNRATIKEIIKNFCNNNQSFKYDDVVNNIENSYAYSLFKEVNDFIGKITDKIFNDYDNITTNQQKYAYNPIYTYNTNIVMKNVVTKTDSNFGESYDDKVIGNKIDNNVLYVHPHNIDKILKYNSDLQIDVSKLDRALLYGKVLNIEHLKALIEYAEIDNNINNKFFKQYKSVIHTTNNNVVQCKMKYEPILGDIKEDVKNYKLLFDKETGFFYYEDDDQNKFNIVEYNNFIKINSDIWNKINVNEQDNENEFFDMFVYRPLSDIEYDQKFSETYPIIWESSVNSIQELEQDGTKIEQLDSMLYHCFNSAYVQDREETIFYKNYSLNNITEVKLFDNINSETEVDTYYRYNCDNSALFINTDDVKQIPASATIYQDAFSNSSVEYYILSDANPEFAKYNMNVITENDTVYGFYILKINMNNTSSLFNIRGFLDSSLDNNASNIEQISLLKYITFINGIDISEVPTYVQDIFKQLCPFLFINLLPFMSQLETVMTPNTFNLTTVFQSLQNNNLSSKERILKYNKQTIVSAKKQILQRYTNAITPYLKPTVTVNNQYMLKYKQINKTLLDTGKYPSLGDYVLLPYDININNYKGTNLYEYSGNLESSYNTPIGEYIKYEYKHYNKSKMINLEKYFEVELNEIIPYSKLIDKENYTETVNIFKSYINRYINIKENDEILFLFKKYKVNYDTSIVGTTLDGSEKTYKLKYKFTLL